MVEEYMYVQREAKEARDTRGAADPDPDLAGYLVDFVDPIRILRRIWLDPCTVLKCLHQ